ncbi:hypothetical protein DFQ01_12080 [Paenibacillus cellulosilyticus]|uniref:Uncharacterized protein n=1 Tax=Paenibacillus cellulosilyticus TaxID=375489 RepID=A0A2V2YPE2_9BACL|nr:hypothetical protein [Paenibacillus cellulosilyticus]PWV97893.1 hypothetical protein DFQ01_12080 [Paenibacillus cellulosilyticus]QKS46936.1 hypothetical protein HUB94_20915 [Paenibacillus cellulosilyticus]
MSEISFRLKLVYDNLKISDIDLCLEKLLKFSPNRIDVLDDVYTKNKLVDFINSIFTEQPSFIFTLSDSSGNSMTVNKENNQIIFFSRINFELFSSSDLFEEITEVFVSNNGLFAYIVSTEDHFWQNNSSVDVYKRRNRSLEDIKVIPIPKMRNRWNVDIEQFPGHNHNYRGLWFGSCSMMWYGNEYFNYFNRKEFEAFSECEEVLSLKNGGYFVKLYSNPLNYEDVENRNRQWAFRSATNLDLVAENVKELLKTK